MSGVPHPHSAEEFSDAIRSSPRVSIAGAGTKPRLAPADGLRISTTELRGIIDYEPSEFTFTALAGTPLQEIEEALARRGQYMPFDPMLRKSGATLGGAVAAGLNGPGRFRYGGLRDFILGVRFVDGSGRLLRLGGKVVKNAAGFDLPKFFVGGLGRFGALCDLTFKVFPAPPSRLTLALEAPTVQVAAGRMIEAAHTPWEIEAIDQAPRSDFVAVRLAGPAEAISQIARHVLARWPGRILEAGAAERFWDELLEFRWAHEGGVLAKVVLAPDDLIRFLERMEKFDDARVHVSAGGNVAYVSLPAAGRPAPLSGSLRELDLRGMTIRGEAPLWLGTIQRTALEERVKSALDLEGRFADLT